MTGATRKDVDSAGGALIEGSPNVFINGHAAVRIGDAVAGHGPGEHGGPVMATGSPVVLTNMIPQCRESDDVATCGHPATGSDNVFVGGTPYPVFVVLEPGVMLVTGQKVYDNSKEGQAAIVRDTTYMPTDTDAPSTVEGQPKFQSCDQLPQVITMTEMGQNVSKYFKLGSCKNLPCDQRGLTANKIACNWMALCNTILDPVYEQFKFSFNSGFRTVASGMGNSDHGLGCAADISMPSTAQTIEMFKWILRQNLPFSQIIYEKHNSAWVHVSYRGKPQSDETKIMWTYTGAAPYGHGGANGRNLPAELKP